MKLQVVVSRTQMTQKSKNWGNLSFWYLLSLVKIWARSENLVRTVLSKTNGFTHIYICNLNILGTLDIDQGWNIITYFWEHLFNLRYIILILFRALSVLSCELVKPKACADVATDARLIYNTGQRAKTDTFIQYI